MRLMFSEFHPIRVSVECGHVSGKGKRRFGWFSVPNHPFFKGHLRWGLWLRLLGFGVSAYKLDVSTQEDV